MPLRAILVKRTAIMTIRFANIKLPLPHDSDKTRQEKGCIHVKKAKLGGYVEIKRSKRNKELRKEVMEGTRVMMLICTFVRDAVTMCYK